MPSSFFSSHEDHLDPALFVGEKLRPDVRNALLQMLYGHLEYHYQEPDAWSNLWIAGSAVSYQWAANQNPGDLDMLIGIDYVLFRKTNATFRGLSDVEISKHFNDEFRTELTPHTTNWSPGSGATYEVTWYSNASSYRIQDIKPYAAYLLNLDEWTVPPSKEIAQIPKIWEQRAAEIAEMGQIGIQRYSAALTAVQNATNPAHRINAQQQLHDSLDQISGLFEKIHQGRKQAFSPTGEGYADLNNYLWQAGKEHGWLHAARKLSQYRDELAEFNDISTYGVQLPDHDVLLRRAMTAYSATNQ